MKKTPVREDNALHDLSPQELADSQISNRHVNAIWVRFKSEQGETYELVHVFPHFPQGSYLLLTGKSGNSKDFARVRKIIQRVYRGWPEHVDQFSLDEGSRQIINLNWFLFSRRLTQHSIAKLVKNFYQRKFREASISSVYFLKPLNELQPNLAST